jgi:ribosomal protein S18 acetylase RimI-like enzyme
MVDTRALAEQIERASIAGFRACIEAARHLAPNLGASIIDVAGGVAAFAGAASPLTEATGVGSFVEPARGDIDRLTRFYAERGAASRVLVSPLAHAALARELARARYAPLEYQNVMFCEIDPAQTGLDERVAESNDHAEFGRTSATGFLERDPQEDEALVGIIIARASTMIPLELRVDGNVVATAAMDVYEDIAGLHGASTMPHARRRGYQTALIRERITRAQALGARYVHAVAAVGSASERNFRRAGFDVLFTRTLWERHLAP